MSPPPEAALPPARRGPASLLLAGGAVVLPVGFLQLALDPWAAGLVGEPGWARDAAVAFGTTALTEECAKAAVLVLLLRKEAQADARRGRAAGALVGLGFAACETVFAPVPALGLAWRLALAVPGHVLDGLLLGHFTRAPEGGPATPSRLLRGLVLVVALHGLWDLGVFRVLAGDSHAALLIPGVLALQVALAAHLYGLGERLPALPRPLRLGFRGLGGVLGLLGAAVLAGGLAGGGDATREGVVGGGVWMALGAGFWLLGRPARGNATRRADNL